MNAPLLNRIRPALGAIVRTSLACAVLAVLAANVANAQSRRRDTSYYPRNEPRPAVEPGYTYVEPQHSSTAGGDIIHAFGHGFEGFGQFLYWASRATVEHQEAFERWIENNEARIRVYWAIQKDYQRERELRAKRQWRPFSYWVDLARKAAPRRLNAQELTYQGQIEFPALLCDSTYEPCRARIRELFAERAYEPDAGKRHQIDREIRTICNDWLEALKEKTVGPAVAEYTAAKKFIRSLKYETEKEPRRLQFARR